MTQDALIIMGAIEDLFKKEISNIVIFHKNVIIVEFENGTKAKITIKNVA